MTEKEKAIAWLERQGKQKKQVHFPKFTFDDILALQCCMETVKKVKEDKELYEQLNLIHSKMYDAYWLGKQDEQASLQTNERAWLYLISDVLTWKDGIGQYLDDSNVQELAKKLCNKYAQKLYVKLLPPYIPAYIRGRNAIRLFLIVACPVIIAR